MTAIRHGEADGDVGGVITRILDLVNSSLNDQLAWAPSIVGGGRCFEVVKRLGQAYRQGLACKKGDTVIDTLAKVFRCALQE